MNTNRIIFWIAVYLALVLAPLGLLLAGPVPAGRGFALDAALALGYLALAVMGVQFLLTARFRRATAPFGIDIIYYFHRLIALVGLALLVGHVLLVYRAKPGLGALLLSGAMPWHLAAACASLGLFALLIGLSLWRKQLHTHYEPWRRLHGALAVAAVLLAVAHVEGSGYYLHEPWKRAAWTGGALGWVLLIGYIRLLKPALMLRRPYRVTAVQAERANTWTLTLQPEGHAGLRFLPGQFTWLTLGHSPFAANEHPFSIASSAEHPERLDLTIKDLGDFTHTIRQVKPGAAAYLDGPYGAFTIDFHPAASGFVFIAGGVGIAPVMSMLRTLADRGDTRPLTLLYGNMHWENVIFREELEALRARLPLDVVHVLQEGHEGWDGETGFLTQDVLARHLPLAAEGREYFVCGPKPMIALVERGLHGLGVPQRHVRSELFDLV
ncbi:MAG: oxidoreductase [Candidatus Hydrogenedens sp.]|nr:oxidoreductase [Candidatus Hydrogenedens sp.]